MGKVIQTIEAVLAYCEKCEKRFTPRKNRRVHTCPGCKAAVLGAEDVPLRGQGVSTMISEKITRVEQ